MKREIMHPMHVEFIPKKLEEGILYISYKFSTTSHLCCCGCGTKIVTPIHPTEYALSEHGGLVSLFPSIGNWNHPCQSHYFITKNRVKWESTMSAAQIRAGRAYDDYQRDAYFNVAPQPWWYKAISDIKKWLGSILR